MSVPQAELDRAIASAKLYEQQGYFERVRAGDKKASGLFVRLVALDLNPTGATNNWGWLTKAPGETQVDGFAEDAICWTADPANRENAVDMINGAGAPGASIGGSVKERREHNKWYKPEPLTPWELAYLQAGGAPPQPQPIPPPTPSFPYPDEATAVKAYQERVRKSYSAAGRTFPDPNDSDAFRHFSRYGYSCSKMAEPEAANKHITELRQELGAPPE